MIDPLMGWTSSDDMRQQVQLEFDTREEAVAYAEKHGIPYQVFEPHAQRPSPNPIPTISASTARCRGAIDGCVTMYGRRVVRPTP